MEGFAQTAGNLGQLLIDEARLGEAEELIRDAYEVVKAKGDSVAIQYACMNMGILATAQNRPTEAIAWYTYVLQRYPVVVSYVQHFCVQQVIQLCLLPEVNRPALAASMRKVAEPVFGTLLDTSPAGSGGSTSRGRLAGSLAPKDVAIVLDCSGSMAGSFIRACRTSIKDIILNYTTLNTDRISLTTFSYTPTPIFPLTLRTDDTTRSMIKDVDTKTVADGGTAFWDALLHTITDSSSPPSHGFRDRYIVSLTDGYDNCSSSTSHARVLHTLKKSHLSLIVITVGHLQNQREIQEACSASQGGLLVKAEESGEGIREAFGKAA
ncbi:hypothetical protein HK104_007889, partial [Borealophlyctis nickersoniae]